MPKKSAKRRPRESQSTTDTTDKPSKTGLWSLVVVGTIVVAGCGWYFIANRNDTPSHESNSSAAWDVAEKIVVRLPNNDPNSDGWGSEAFEVESKKHLKQLIAELIAFQIEPAKGFDFLAADFRCTDFVGNEFDEFYETPPFRIRRIKSLPLLHEGKSGLRTAIAHFRERYPQAKYDSFEIKVVGVDLSAPKQPVTTQLVSMAGEFEGTHFEIHATWEAHWTETKRLQSLWVSKVEESTLTQTPPLFADCTTTVLGELTAEGSLIERGHADYYQRYERRFGHQNSSYHGLAIGDANGDNLDDVYLCHPGGLANQLLIRQADGSVIDSAASAGLDWLDRTHSALFVDLDNDEDQDLVIGKQNFVLILSNNGNGVFQVEARLGPRKHLPLSLAAADYDSDGDLDIYVCYYEIGVPLPQHDANNGPKNTLWRNDGRKSDEDDWQFKDVTKEVGLDQNNNRFSFAACWEDYDNDGDLDLYVANDFGRNNLFQFEKGRFKDVASRANAEDTASGMSVSFADYDHDGRMDLYISNMFSSAGNRIATQPRFQSTATDEARDLLHRQARGNSLFRATTEGKFEDVSVSMNVTMGRWAWGSLFADINNDSYDDLCIANGYITNNFADDL